MSEKERAFCSAYAANGGNGAAAARSAGYSERSARAQASRLLRRVDILQQIEFLQKQAETARVASVQEVKERLSVVLRSDTERTRDRIRAGEILLKGSGEFTAARQQVQSGIALTEDWEPAEAVLIALPAIDGEGEAASAYMLPDGQVIPKVGHEKDDCLIYVELQERQTEVN